MDRNNGDPGFASTSPSAVDPENTAATMLRANPSSTRFGPSVLRAAGWAALSVHRARRTLRTAGVTARIPSPPTLPAGSTRGVLGLLRRVRPTCLERATVLQSWLTAHGTPVDIVIGVLTEDGNVLAHAWIQPAGSANVMAGYREIHRIPPPTA